MTESTSRTPSQKIAELEAQIARLRQAERAVENGQKIILGGLLLTAARSQPNIRAWLLKEAAQHVTRPADTKRLAPLLDELRALPVPVQAG